MRFLIDGKMSVEMASGIISQTMVNHWMLRNVATVSGEIVQKRLINDFEEFMSVITLVQNGSYSETVTKRYFELLQRRKNVYDIFVSNKTQYTYPKTVSEEVSNINVNTSVDFPMYDFNIWKQSGHLITFGEIIGAVQFMVDKNISVEVASGIIAQTLVNHWKERNIGTESEEAIQTRLYREYQEFASLKQLLNAFPNVSENTLRHYEILKNKRASIFDIYSYNDPKSFLVPDQAIVQMATVSRSISPAMVPAEMAVSMGVFAAIPNTNIDFPAIDFNVWRNSGHLITYGEIIGGMRFMINTNTTEEVASGMIAHTLVNHWIRRNVYPKSEKTVQKRIYKDFQDFLLAIDDINRHNLSETTKRRYESLLDRRNQVYDIFVGSDPEALKRTRMLEETFGVNMEAQHYRYLESQLSDIPRGDPQKLVSIPKNDHDYSVETDQLKLRGYHVVP